MIVDIRDLNKIIITNSYFLPLQADVIDMLLSIKNINILDDVFFFLQFDIWPSNWHKQIVVSHRKLKYFKIVVIGYKGSLSYMQRIINKELRPYKNFVKIYIDDLIIFSSIFEMHFIHLRKLFQLLLKLKIIINFKKTFFNYSSITLLGQKVDTFDLSIIEEKIEALTKLKFSVDLEVLKHYLNLID